MKLLVSVRTAEEACAALAGGADIIDVKDPAAGALGMASPQTLTAIRAVVPDSISLSLALGEVIEREQHLPASLPRSDFAKLGLAGLNDPSHFQQRWVNIRQQVDANAPSPRRWIAVVYADHRGCNAPTPETVLQAACATHCAGLLFDTSDKQSGHLWSHLSDSQLKPLIIEAQAQGLLVAVAGRLGLADIPAAASLGVDIFAVRSAACVGGSRDGPVCRHAVAELRAQLPGSN
ncbi:MAG: hypothetical protein KDA90_01060 [Planctomycetaceae bacterium]|nr:hypothetical protein [Planctomycetaceae bacterium]